MTIGRTISHYKIIEKIGEGGIGVVYKAEDTKLGRSVALKFLAAHLLQDAESRKRFVREAKAAAALNHPNICTVYEIDEAEGETFISMAFLDGVSLDKKIEAAPLKLPDALDIAVQTAQGLRAAHGKPIVHRDIKPANLMVGESGGSRRRDVRRVMLVSADFRPRPGVSTFRGPFRLSCLVPTEPIPTVSRVIKTAGGAGFNIKFLYKMSQNVAKCRIYG